MYKSARYEACIGYCMTRCKIVPGLKLNVKKLHIRLSNGMKLISSLVDAQRIPQFSKKNDQILIK